MPNDKIVLKGFDELQDAFKAISSVPLSVTKKAVKAMGETARDAIRAEGESMGVRSDENSQHILDNISVSKPAKRDDGVKAFVNFKGVKQRGSQRVWNAEIAYLVEYGAPQRGIPARPFIATGIARSEDEIAAKADEIIGGWIEETYAK